MKPSRIALYIAIALVAVVIGVYYLNCEVPESWYWPANIVHLLTKH